MGPKVAQNRAWINYLWNYTESGTLLNPKMHQVSLTAKYAVFRTCTLLQLSPPWMHPIVCLFLPSYWRVKRCLRCSVTTVTLEIEQFLRSHDGEYLEADGHRGRPESHELAYRPS